MTDESPLDQPPPSPETPQRNKGGRPPGSKSRKPARAGAALSAQQIGEIAAKAALAAVQQASARSLDQMEAMVERKLSGINLGAPRVIPAERVGTAKQRPVADIEDDDFDPVKAGNARLAAARVGAEHSGTAARASGLSDAEVLAMFQAQDVGEFDIPPEIVPEGFVYQYKRHEVIGKGDRGYDQELARFGWRPVLYSDHEGVFGPKGEPGPVINKGLILMKRTVEMEELRQRYQKLLAKQAVRDKIAQLASAPAGTGPRSHPKVAPQVSRTYEPMPIE